ncbi:hypothetical protein MWH93_004396 [Salmonella enterica]|uniref:Uncharacterized protein n=2 Tax=Salmonella enterica I TaxID=59201 RepID=A0A626IRB6_SALET|nr:MULTISPECIES: hypothetical protein [Enterobacteriaceae]EAB9678589.1 hypothetical protein [Salmonella enterica subsp. enterica serovar Agona]EAU8990177.1 hypothetical protein [Salmonella enterica]EBG0324164.1 hypothetical protein [Salmonella enterica subsp. enterica serovar Infantis]EBW1918401.1 hypothetical protein [Salmonella enterica subsp. enterica serovar Newport]EBY7590455.1 hypothetical protein [Salmonella enterica subsp. enterica serovar Typhimurium]ECD1218820.1 hypothetical protein
MKKSNEQNENGYFVRNNWLLYVFAALMLVCSQWMVATLEMGFQLPDMLIYAGACILLVYAGFLNIQAGTTTAILFQIAVIACVLFSLLWMVVKNIWPALII